MSELPEQTQNQAGPMVGIIIIVLVFALGGLYFWGERLSSERQRLRDNQTEEARLLTETEKTSSSTEPLLGETSAASSTEKN